MSILCYHAVDPDWRSPLSITPAEFQAHCAWLARHRRVIGAAEAAVRLAVSSRLPRRWAALTFDDGFRGVFQHAFPLLTRYRLPATMFLVAQTLTPEGRPVDWVDGMPSGQMATVTLDEVHEMQRAGIRFGSHSYAHHDLTSLSEEECLRDLRASRELLEDLLETRITLLAYPRGLHSERVRRAANRAGFAHAFTLPERRESIGPHAIPRVGVYPGNGTTALRAKASPWYLPLRTSRVFPVLRLLAGRGTHHRMG
ncbi:MAG TPA: polysaccharide deacetylase family protein [Actinomycetota bacterium]|nr:polysaccharide deacetylase family protein [Actinomycetota bacterium]